ncbi:MAG: hypothetical protein Gyms2KO_00270 [Gymnodinialimonas sp.]
MCEPMSFSVQPRGAPSALLSLAPLLFSLGVAMPALSLSSDSEQSMIASAAAASTMNAVEREVEVDFRHYESQIEALEVQHGAYAAGLSEPLLGLGLALQSQGRHDEAVEIFKRGAHLARINDGLHSAAQIPLLQGEISSHLASGDYASVEDRQRYLYRVQLRSRDSTEGLAHIFLQQAEWQYQAYRLGVGDAGSRLGNMRRLYLGAYNDVVQREGASSPALIPPLQYLMRTYYLIADYNPPAEPADSQGWAKDLSRQRENLGKTRNYTQGRAVISMLYGLEQEAADDISPGTARARIMLGDWHLYNSRHDAARAAYDTALQELDALDAAQTQQDAVLGQPVPLPDIDGLRPLSLTPGQAANGDIMLQYTVNRSGRAVDIKRLDTNKALNSKARRVERHLKRTRFRPRFEGGQPVRTENLVYAVDIQ